MNGNAQGGVLAEARSRWVTADGDETAARRLASALDLPLAVATLLVSRGYAGEQAARDFLAPRLSDLSDPLGIAGMPAVADRLARAVRARETVAVFGDYDVDGITATALMVRVLAGLEVPVAPFLPERDTDGYGFTATALKRCLASLNPSLIVTVDCGTHSATTVELAHALGVDVIVTDHHEAGGAGVPAGMLVANPKLGSPAASADLAGVGVAFKLCHALIKRLRAEPDARLQAAVSRVDLRDMLGWVALGTVCDIVPLTGENRTLVRHGLERLNAGASLGVDALRRVAGLTGRLSSGQIGFQVGPRLNAAGRLGSAGPALELLLVADPVRAAVLAQELNEANRERQRIEQDILQEAEAILAAASAAGAPEAFGIVVGREGWDIGVIGIVAARLCRRRHRAAVVVSLDGQGRGRGSARSIQGLDLIEALAECAPWLEEYGGHKLAAGVSLRQDQFEGFGRAFEQVCARRLADADLRPVQTVDAWLTHLGEADECLLTAVERLEPFGSGNPTPLWGMRGVTVLGEPRRVGRDGAHLKMTVACGGAQRDTIGFGLGAREVPPAALDILFEVDRNEYAGRSSIQLRVRDFRPAAGPF